MDQNSAERRWGFLEDRADACGVVTRRMKLVFLNAPARSLVPDDWFRSRCWDAFPVWNGGCAASCPAVRAVATGCAGEDAEEGIVYCEEKLDVGGDGPLVLGAAVISLPEGQPLRERGLLLLRPKVSVSGTDEFRRGLIADAVALSTIARERFGWKALAEA